MTSQIKRNFRNTFAVCVPGVGQYSESQFQIACKIIYNRWGKIFSNPVFDLVLFVGFKITSGSWGWVVQHWPASRKEIRYCEFMRARVTDGMGNLRRPGPGHVRAPAQDAVSRPAKESAPWSRDPACEKKAPEKDTLLQTRRVPGSLLFPDVCTHSQTALPEIEPKWGILRDALNPRDQMDEVKKDGRD